MSSPSGETPRRGLPEMMAEAEALRVEVEALTGPNAAAKAILPPGAVGTGLAPADVTKEQMALVRAEAMKKQMQLRDLTEEMRQEMDRVRFATQALMKPLEEQIKVMNEGIWTIELYLGNEEEIVELTHGEPAPADTPITLRQEVLSMDEETAALTEDGDGMDARNLDVFDEWITRPENLDLILPEPKGVVVLVPRSRGRDYQDPWMNRQMAEENKWSYFLLRNGENLYRIKTDFIVGKHLIPGPREFTNMFMEKRRNHSTGETESVPLLPGTHEWEKAAKAQDARQRHYMRMALILQGLIDRTPVFHPLPDGGINLLDMRTYDEGRAHLLLDAEGVLTDGREPFSDWLRRLNGELRVGMRIIGEFSTKEFKEAGEEYTDSYGGRSIYSPNDRVTPRARNAYDADKPSSHTLYRLEGRKTVGGTQGFTFKFERGEKWMRSQTYYGEELRKPKTKATCVVMPYDNFILPFDLVTVEEMRYYLRSRVNRTHYEHMFPLLKAAIAAKEAEAEAEAPFRRLLAAALIDADPSLDDGDADLARAHAALDPLVDWWKLGNKHHRALTGDPAAEKAAIKAIVAEHLARTSDGARATSDGEAEAEQKSVDALLAHDPSIMFIARKRDGGYLAFAPQPRKWNRQVAKTNLWVTEHTTTKTARSIKTREWLTVGARAEGLRVLHSTPVWEKWDRFTAPTDDLTDPEIEGFLDALIPAVPDEVASGWATHWWNGVRHEAPLDVLTVGVTHERKKKTFTVWFTDAANPAALDEAPRADSGGERSADLGYSEHKVTATWTKTAKGGAVLAPREQWNLRSERGGRYSGGGSPSRPWRYVWDGKEKGPGVIVAYPEAGAVAEEREAAIKRFRKAESALHEPTTRALRLVAKGIRAIKEQVAREEFVAEYLDETLWEGQVKILRSRYSGDPFEPNFAGGRYYRGVPNTLVKALDMLTDAGITYEGLTVRTCVEKAGLDPKKVEKNFDEKWDKQPIPGARFMDLPVWVEPEPDQVDDDDDEVEDEESLDDILDGEFDEHGTRTEADGTVIISGVVAESVSERIDEASLPAVIDQED